MKTDFTPGSWCVIEAMTGWRPHNARMPSFNDVLKARIRFNEELRQHREEAKKWKGQ